MSDHLSDEERDHLWDKVHKCKSTTANVTVNKEALLHLLMDQQNLHGQIQDLRTVLSTGKKS